ncbi:hypothetical protein ACUF8D_004247, partial [Klebsiella aerogenes]
MDNSLQALPLLPFRFVFIIQPHRKPNGRSGLGYWLLIGFAEGDDPVRGLQGRFTVSNNYSGYIQLFHCQTDVFFTLC